MRRLPASGFVLGPIAALALACADADLLGPPADRCAEVVAFYLGVEAPVEVTSGQVDAAESRVRIDYRTERAILPLEGRAICRFTEAAGGGLDLSAAFVDDNRLRPDEVEAFNRAHPAHSAAPDQ